MCLKVIDFKIYNFEFLKISNVHIVNTKVLVVHLIYMFDINKFLI
jgi:hypothetical protein